MRGTHFKKGVWSGTRLYEPKTYCAFYDPEADDCIALKCLYCAYESAPCNFYKRRKEVEKKYGY